MSSNTTNDNDNLILATTVVGVHGIMGNLKIKVLTNLVHDVFSYNLYDDQLNLT